MQIKNHITDKNTDRKLNAIIVGASGYTGAECYRLLLNHPQIEVEKIQLVANANAGQDIYSIYHHFYNNPRLLQKLDEVDFENADLAFFCLPHGQSQKIIMDIYTKHKHLKIIDLSADFRMSDTALYEKIYHTTHIAKNTQMDDVIYGLCEIATSETFTKKRIIAVPGCYPTSAILPLFPLVKAGLLKADSKIIIDSKSGLSGAGRRESAPYLHAERSDNTIAYGIFTHRHRYEIAEKLETSPSLILFTPHLVPQIRGIESTIYATLQNAASAEAAKQTLINFYKNQPFVKIVDFPPSTALVKGTNNVLIYIAFEAENIIISCVVDNICKGSSGAAVQCMNLAFNLPQTAGLAHLQSYV